MAQTQALIDAGVRFRLPRPLHPMAWWVWAIGAAAVVSTGSNPLFIVAVLAAVTLVVLARRGDNPWAGSFKVYVYLGLFVVVMRVAYRVIFGGGDGPTILFRLPYIPLPYWVGGIRLLGPVSLEALLAGLYDGLRLAGIIVCLGAANALANPKRLLASLPGAFYEIGTVMVVAIGVFPQLGDSVTRVMRARKLRPQPTDGRRFRRYRVVRTIIIPVLSDALDRCLLLAASMDARGYGRAGGTSRTRRGLTTTLILGALILLGVGSYGLLSSRPLVTKWQEAVIGWPMIGAGIAAAVVGLWSAGAQVQRTTYRPDRWRVAEVVTVASSLAAWLVVRSVSNGEDAGVLYPTINPFEWPTLILPLGIALVLVALPALATPPPRLTTTRGAGAESGVS